jgi:hypothetical protein
VTGSPVLGGGAVWSLNPRAGFLHVMDETSGRSLATASVGEATRFASPVLSGEVVLVPTFAGITALTIS